MRWNLTKADSDSAPKPGQQTYEEAIRRNFLFARLEDMVAWGKPIRCGRLISDFPVVTWKWRLRSPVATTSPASALK